MGPLTLKTRETLAPRRALSHAVGQRPHAG
jgi:hypothetical protein